MDIQVELFTHCRDNISRVLVEQLGLKEADGKFDAHLSIPTY